MGFAQGTALEVRELQIEGKKRMGAHDFINGYRPRSDELLGG
jgi:methionyl-tRNA formyltransferase